MLKRFTFLLFGFLAAVTMLVSANSKVSSPGPDVSSAAEVMIPITEVDNATNHTETIVLGAGCFWGAEKRYAAIPGVLDAVSGYADGRGFAATYQNITKWTHRNNPDNYAEVVEVTYNQNLVSLEEILQVYYETHDPTQLNRQGNDIGTQYRSTILYHTEQQQQVAQAVTAEFQTLLSEAGYGTITTKIAPLEQFHPAEEYHQDYLVKNPNGYCPDHSTGVTFNPTDPTKNVVDNTALMVGKQILVLDSESYCPYCEQFKKKWQNLIKEPFP